MNEILSEQGLRDAVALVGRAVEAGGAFVIFCGVVLAFVRFVVTALRDRRAASFVPIRLDLGRFLALGLEFQLASDICARQSGPRSVRSVSWLPSPPSAPPSTTSWPEKSVLSGPRSTVRSRPTPDCAEVPSEQAGGAAMMRLCPRLTPSATT